MNGTCNLCNKSKPLVKSHLAPKSFYKNGGLLDSNGNTIMASASEDSKIIRHAGVVDFEILCAGCDNNVIGKYDTYGKEFAFQDFEKKYTKKHYAKRNINYYEIENIDYNKLKLFFLSVIWRFSISKSFSDFSLGNKENHIKNLILSDNAADVQDCGVILSKLSSSGSDVRRNNFIAPPITFRHPSYSNLNCIGFHLGGFKVIVNVDKRKNDLLSKFMINDTKFIMTEHTFDYKNISSYREAYSYNSLF